MRRQHQPSLVAGTAAFAAFAFFCDRVVSAQMPPPPPPGVVMQMPEKADPSLQIPHFDVISVRPSKDNQTRVQFTTDGMRGMSVTPHFLLTEGFGVISQNQVVGEPAWSTTEGFDLEAKVAAADVPTLAKMTVEQRGAMFQQILVERFKLVTHHETRELPEYQLTIGKNGPKLKPSTPEDAASKAPRPSFVMFGPGKVTVKDSPLSVFLKPLSRLIDRVTVDKTGLAGKFDFALVWTPDGAAPFSASSGAASQEESGPDIFTAIQEQLGLKLTSSKGPVDVIVIDHIEKPSVN